MFSSNVQNQLSNLLNKTKSVITKVISTIYTV